MRSLYLYVCIVCSSKTDSDVQKALDADSSYSVAQHYIGKALLLITRDYVKAVEYFHNALQSSPQCIELRWELARLYMKLKKYQKAVDTLMCALIFREHENGISNTTWNNNNTDNNIYDSRHEQYTTDSMRADVETLCLITKAYVADDKPSHGRQCLLKAVTLQDILIQRSKLEKGGGEIQIQPERQTKKAGIYRFYDDGGCDSDTEAGYWSVHHDLFHENGVLLSWL